MQSIRQKKTNETDSLKYKSFICLLFIFTFFFSSRVNAATFPVTNNLDAGAGSLRQAIIDANANPGADIIDATGVAGTISLLSVLPNITGSVTINGPGMTLLTISQTIDRRVFTTGSGAVIFVLQDLTLNFAGPGTTPYSGGGGAILAGGAGASTTLTNVTISNFRFQIGSGGAISQSSSLNIHNLTITNCIFTNNACGGGGGAVSYNGLGTATISGCTFSNDSTGIVGANTGGDGGAIATTGGGAGGNYTIEKNTFLNNQVKNVTGHGGAKININGASTVRFNRFIGNTCLNVANPPLANIIAQTSGATVNTTVADNNWWGVNTGPGVNDAASLGAGGTMTLTKWLQLKTTASPNPICITGSNTSTVTTSFLSNSDNEAILVSNLSSLIGLPVTWSQTLGSLSGEQNMIQAAGTATATFTSSGTAGIATINAQVDNVPASETSPARANITVNEPANAGTDGDISVCDNSSTVIDLYSIITGEQTGGVWSRLTGTGGTFNAGAGTYTPAAGATTSTFKYFVTGAPCSDDESIATVNISAQANAGIDGSTSVCDNSSTPIDLYSLITGEQTGGTWSRLTGTGGTFNAGAGTFTPAPGTTTSTFKYLVSGTAPCPNDESVATVNISAQANAGADGNTSVCDNSTTPIDLYSIITGEQTGGVWSRLTGTGGTFSAGAGTFTPAASATTSTFKYLLTGTTPCPDDESVATVNISAQANAGADGNTSVCDNSTTPIDLYSLITGEQIGGTWSRLTGSGGTFSAGAGTFTPAAGATTSTFNYLVTGTTPCPDDESVATVNITAEANAGADGSTDVCQDASSVVNLYSLITGEQAGGVWTRLTGSGGTFNAGAGTFTTAAGTTTSTFKYLVTGTSPCPDDESIATVNIIICCTPVNSGTIASGDQTICYSGDPSNITFSTAPSGGAVGGSFNYQWYYKNGVADPCPTGTNTSGWTLISGATGSSYDPPSGLTTSRTYAVTVDPTGTPDCGPATWANSCRKVTVNPAVVATCSNNNPSLYFGAPGNQTATVKVIATGGTAPYTVSITMNRPLLCNVITSSGDELWSGVGGTSVNNVCPVSGPGLLPPVSTGNVAASGGFYSVNVTLIQDAVFTATVTDALGCVSTCTTSIHAEDVRCFAGNSGNAKVRLCHQTGSNNNPCMNICVDESEVAAHLAHGDFVGNCKPDCVAPVYTRGVIIEKEPVPFDLFRVKVIPNPTDNYFTLDVESGSTEKIIVVVYDVLGRKVKHFEKGDGLIQFGEDLKVGSYMAVVRQGNNTKTVKLIKQ